MAAALPIENESDTSRIGDASGGGADGSASNGSPAGRTITVKVDTITEQQWLDRCANARAIATAREGEEQAAEGRARARAEMELHASRARWPLLHIECHCAIVWPAGQRASWASRSIRATGSGRSAATQQCGPTRSRGAASDASCTPVSQCVWHRINATTIARARTGVTGGCNASPFASPSNIVSSSLITSTSLATSAACAACAACAPGVGHKTLGVEPACGHILFTAKLRTYSRPSSGWSQTKTRWYAVVQPRPRSPILPRPTATTAGCIQEVPYGTGTRRSSAVGTCRGCSREVSKHSGGEHVHGTVHRFCARCVCAERAKAARTLTSSKAVAQAILPRTGYCLCTAQIGALWSCAETNEEAWAWVRRIENARRLVQARARASLEPVQAPARHRCQSVRRPPCSRHRLCLRHNANCRRNTALRLTVAPQR